MPIFRKYDEIKGINNSLLAHFKRSPEHYLEAYHKPPEKTDAMVFGIAFHVYVLEPHKFEEEITVFDPDQRPVPDSNFSKKENKEWKSELMEDAEVNGKEIITTDKFEAIKKMRDKLYSVDQSREILEYTRNKFEVTQEWNWKKSKCKALVDIKNDEFLADIKTTANADPDEFWRSFFKYDYHRQAGMYVDGDANGKIIYNNVENAKDFFFIAIEKAPPFGVAVFKPNKEVIMHGIDEYRRLVGLWQNCIDSGEWGGYETKSLMGEPFDISLPSWM